jgi:hypothetical protein
MGGNMADKEWTVKDLVEALKQFPLDAKVYYEMGPNGPGWESEIRQGLGRKRRDGSAIEPIGSLTRLVDGLRLGIVVQASKNPHTSCNSCRTGSINTSYSRVLTG